MHLSQVALKLREQHPFDANPVVEGTGAFARCDPVLRPTYMHTVCTTLAGPGGVPLQLSVDGKCFVGPTGMPVRTDNGSRLR